LSDKLAALFEPRWYGGISFEIRRSMDGYSGTVDGMLSGSVWEW